jgi:hypothetical protein
VGDELQSTTAADATAAYERSVENKQVESSSTTKDEGGGAREESVRELCSRTARQAECELQEGKPSARTQDGIPSKSRSSAPRLAPRLATKFYGH